MKGGFEVKVWHSYDDEDRAIDTLETYYRITGTIVPELLNAYQAILATASKGMIAHFYERITAEAPELLKFFS